jgi:uncharacterized protein
MTDITKFGLSLLLLFSTVGVALAASPPVASVTPPKFKVLALAEAGGHHLAFTKAARPWLKQCGEDNGFEVDYIADTTPITEAILAKYRLVL